MALVPLIALAADESGTPSKSSAEFARHWASARKLAVAVAEAMPPAQYAFRPDPGSMSFGEQISHLVQTNYAFCAGLKDSKAPAIAADPAKDALVKSLGDSFDYCSATLATLDDQQLDKPDPSPDGRLIARECLLALYGHMAHHRGQADVYLRIKGIKPPSYIF